MKKPKFIINDLLSQLISEYGNEKVAVYLEQCLYTAVHFRGFFNSVLADDEFIVRIRQDYCSE